MEEKIGKKFLLYFRLALLCWILIANAILHIIGFSYGWLIFISNIMLFTLEGDVKERFLTVEIGGLVGLVLTVLAHGAQEPGGRLSQGRQLRLKVHQRLQHLHERVLDTGEPN